MISSMTTPPKALAADRKIDIEPTNREIFFKSRVFFCEVELIRGFAATRAALDDTPGFNIDLLLHFSNISYNLENDETAPSKIGFVSDNIQGVNDYVGCYFLRLAVARECAVSHINVNEAL